MSFYGYYLQDSGKVFLGTNIDSLPIIYDFNLAAADSFLFEIYDSTINHTEFKYIKVHHVDSALYGGTWRKRIVFNAFSSYEFPSTSVVVSWVKGIGDPIYGPTAPLAAIQALKTIGDIDLMCFTENFNPVIGTCNFVGLNETEEIESAVEVFPQPAEETLTIQSKDRRFTGIPVLYDISGKKINAATHFIDDTTYRIDVSKLSPGIYFIFALSDKGYVKKKVLIGL